MIRTFDFVLYLQRDKKERQRVLFIMDSMLEEEYEYRGWHLHFDAERKWVQISDNGRDEHLTSKFIPAEISYRSLISIINKEDISNIEIRYLE